MCLFRSRRSFNIAPCSSGGVSNLEISIGDKKSAFESSGLICTGLIRHSSARDVFSRFIGISKLSSTADAIEKGDEEEKEEELSEPEEAFSVSGNVPEGVEDDSLFEVEVEHSNKGKTTKKRAHSQLYESIITYKSVKHVVELWVKQGKDLSQAEVSLAIHNLRKRRSYAMSLQVKFVCFSFSTLYLLFCVSKYQSP